LIISLKNEAIKTIESLDEEVQEQEKLRQNARAILSIIQRTKVQLIELRPTMNDEADQKLKVYFDLFINLKSNSFLLENRRRSNSKF
jgi:molybdopterin-guanine dinucleotide biosynthesis protein